MRFPRRFMKNAFCLPQGTAGRIGGLLLSLDRGLQSWIVDLLDIQPSDSVLDVGAGPGVAVQLAAQKALGGRVVGVDPSPTILEMASKRNQDAIAAGRVEFYLASAERLPFEDNTFDAAMAINSLHLWPDPERGLREIRRTLRPGGRIALAITRFSEASSEGFERDLINSGYSHVNLHTGERGTCALARV